LAIDYSTQGEVQKQAAAFRHKHGAMDWDAKVNDLIERHGYETGTYHKNSPGVLGKLLSGVTKKVLALVSIKHRLILLSNELPQPKKPFAKGHELGHAVLPWHKEILFACDEHDLSPSARAQLEFEANEFSSEINFPRELLAKVYEQYPMSMDTVLAIRGWTGASIESAANAYAKKHPQKCVLLVLEEKTKDDGSKVLKLQRKVVSERAARDPMSTLTRQQEFKSDHVLFTQSRSMDQVTQAGLILSNSKKRLRISLLNTSYKVLALAFEA
jgi:Zn-dependent peptidase ImmA (M78 family)